MGTGLLAAVLATFPECRLGIFPRRFGRDLPKAVLAKFCKQERGGTASVLRRDKYSVLHTVPGLRKRLWVLVSAFFHQPFRGIEASAQGGKDLDQSPTQKLCPPLPHALNLEACFLNPEP